MNGPIQRRARRQRSSAIVRELLERDRFLAIRTDDELAGLVRRAAAEVPKPFASLLRWLVGVDPAEADEDQCRRLWLEAVAHRRRMAAALGRPVHLRVAALDLLTARRTTTRARPPILVAPDTLGEALPDLAADALTGLPAAPVFAAVLAHELRRRSVRPPVLLFARLDGIHAAAARRGHEWADDARRAFARELGAVASPGDFLGRLAEDEFGAVLPACPPGRARIFAERLRMAFATSPAGAGLTLAAGYAIGRTGQSARALLEETEVSANASRLGRPSRGGGARLEAPAPDVRPRPLAVYATADAQRFFEIHRAAVEWGALLLPASSPGLARRLIVLMAPELVFMDRVFAPGVERACRAAAGPIVTCLVGHARSTSGVAAGAAGSSLTWPAGSAEIERLLSRAFRRRRATPLAALAGDEEARALSIAIAALMAGRPIPAREGARIGSRAEVDALRRHLGA